MTFQPSIIYINYILLCNHLQPPTMQIHYEITLRKFNLSSPSQILKAQESSIVEQTSLHALLSTHQKQQHNDLNSSYRLNSREEEEIIAKG